MKITINNKTLLNALNKVTSVIEKRNTIPILSNVNIAVSSNSVTLQGTDLDITIASVVKDVSVGEIGELTASASMLSDIVKRLPDGDVILEAPSDILHVKAGRSKFKMQTLPSVDFPSPQKPVTSSGFEVDADDLKTWLERVAYCMSTEETRYYLCGVFMHVYNGAIRFVATDGHRFAMQDTNIASEDSYGVIIPRKTVSELVKLCANGGTIKVDWSDRMFIAANEDTTLTSKLIDATYPEYERVIPHSNDNKLTIDANTIKAASDRVASINDEKTRAVKIECRNGEVDLSVQARNDNSANETIDADCNFDLVIGVNSRYFADAMNRINGDASLEFADSNTPMLIREVGDDSYLSLIMPVRVN